MSPGGEWARTGGRPLQRVVYDAETLGRRVRELGQEITRAYPDGPLLLIGLLKGGFVFLADLVRAIERPVQVDFLIARSYGAGKVSSGALEVLYRPPISVLDKHILLVEDIIDSGRTLAALAEVIREEQPRSLAICALLNKGLAPVLPAEVRFLGFQAPDAFLVGYGLDYAEEFRHLPFIADVG